MGRIEEPMPEFDAATTAAAEEPLSRPSAAEEGEKEEANEELPGWKGAAAPEFDAAPEEEDMLPWAVVEEEGGKEEADDVLPIGRQHYY